MKGTEKIIAHIQADAAAQADAIIAQAKQQCAEIREEYDAQARDAYSEKIRAGVKECESKADSADRIARMEAKKEVLALKQEMVSASFDKAAAQIIGLSADRYAAFLAKLAADAASGGEEIVLNERDRAAVGSAVVEKANVLQAQAGKAGGLKLSEKTGSFAGGLVLQRGSVTINCTLELLMDLCRSEMSSEVAGILFA